MWSKMLKPQQQTYSTYRRELMAIQLAMRHFNEDFNGRRLIIFSDHRPLIGTFDSNDLQAHDPLAQNAINEISQFTSDIRFKPGKEIPVADWLSRPEGRPIGERDDVITKNQNIKYVPPEATLAALEARPSCPWISNLTSLGKPTSEETYQKTSLCQCMPWRE